MFNGAEALHVMRGNGIRSRESKRSEGEVLFVSKHLVDDALGSTINSRQDCRYRSKYARGGVSCWHSSPSLLLAIHGISGAAGAGRGNFVRRHFQELPRSVLSSWMRGGGCCIPGNRVEHTADYDSSLEHSQQFVWIAASSRPPDSR